MGSIDLFVCAGYPYFGRVSALVRHVAAQKVVHNESTLSYGSDREKIDWLEVVRDILIGDQKPAKQSP